MSHPDSKQPLAPPDPISPPGPCDASTQPPEYASKLAIIDPREIAAGAQAIHQAADRLRALLVLNRDSFAVQREADVLAMGILRRLGGGVIADLWEALKGYGPADRPGPLEPGDWPS
jgi:hypothetical protein